MAKRTITVVTCDFCGLEAMEEIHRENASIVVAPKGWLYYMPKDVAEKAYRPRVVGVDVDNQYTKYIGIWCSFVCYTEALRKVYKDLGANMSPPPE